MARNNKTVQQSIHDVVCCLGANIENINTTLQEINTTMQDADNDVTQVVITGSNLVVTYEDGTSQTFNIPCTCEASPNIVSNVEFLDLITPTDGVLDTMRVTYGDGTTTDYPMIYAYNVTEAGDHSSFKVDFSDGTSTTVNIDRVTDVTLSGNDLVIHYQDGTTTNITVLCPDAFVNASFDDANRNLTFTSCNATTTVVNIPVGSGTAGIANVYMVNQSGIAPFGVSDWGVKYPTNYDTIVGSYTSNGVIGGGNDFSYLVRRHFDYYGIDIFPDGIWFEGDLTLSSYTIPADLATYMPVITPSGSIDYHMYLNPNPSEVYTPGYEVKADDSPGVKDLITPFQVNLYYILYTVADNISTIYKVGQIKHAVFAGGADSETVPAIELLNYTDSTTSWILDFRIRNVSGIESWNLAIVSFELLYSIKERIIG